MRSRRSLRPCLVALAALVAAATAEAAPVVSNVAASQRAGTRLVDITYDLAVSNFPTVTVSLEISSDGGITWTVPAQTVTGDAGIGVAPGAGKEMVWNAGADWAANYSEQVRFRVVADAGFERVPGGSFVMGATSGDLDEDAPPITVTIAGFYLATTEAPQGLWNLVRSWALAHGYDDLPAGEGKAPDHPVCTVSWFDVVKWCNARSEMEGLTPCYTEGGNVMRTGTAVPDCDWNANGYRLPTEAEWEKAARGGVEEKRFPWGGDTISHDRANYKGTDLFPYDESLIKDVHPLYASDVVPMTNPVRAFSANGYGMKGMAGNLREWCWDRYGADYYESSNGTNDPRGPESETEERVVRGGGWINFADECRAGARRSESAEFVNFDTGFRPVRQEIEPGWTSVGSGDSANTTVDTRSDNAELSGLILDGGSIQPGFDPGTYAYSAHVGFGVSAVTITATVAEENATLAVKVNGSDFAPADSGDPYGPLSLNVGANSIAIRVNAQNTVATRTYGISVTRAKGTQAITFAAPGDRFINEVLALAATGGSSSQGVVFTVVEGPASLTNGNELSFTGSGRVTIRATQDGDDDYESAPAVEHVFTVMLPRPDVAVGAEPARLIGAGTYPAPTGQQATIVSRRARPVTGYVALANRVTLPERRAVDRLAVRGARGNARFAITYRVGSMNATAGLVSGSYRTPELDGSDAPVWIQAVIQPNKKRLSRKRGKRTIYMKRTSSSLIRATSTVYAPREDAGILRVLTR